MLSWLWPPPGGLWVEEHDSLLVQFGFEIGPSRGVVNSSTISGGCAAECCESGGPVLTFLIRCRSSFFGRFE